MVVTGEADRQQRLCTCVCLYNTHVMLELLNAAKIHIHDTITNRKFKCNNRGIWKNSKDARTSVITSNERKAFTFRS